MRDRETTRALIAYLRRPDSDAPDALPDAKRSGPVEFNGKRYIVLRAARGATLAVYRVRAFDGQLKRLKRWPVELLA
jgi:hypothetical protein